MPAGTLIGKLEILLGRQLPRHASDEQLGVEVEAVRAPWSLALDVCLVVNAEHGVAAVAHHYDLMPVTRADLNFAEQRSRPRSRVEPEED